MCDMGLECRTTNIRAIDEYRHDAQIFAQRHRGQLAGAGDTPHAGGQQAVDIAQFQSGFFDGGFCHQRGMTKDRSLCDELAVLQRRIGNADDHRFSSVLHMLFLLLVGLSRCAPNC